MGNRPAGGSYVIISSTIASGASGMTGGTSSVSASRGDLSRFPALAGGPYAVYDALTDGLLIIRAMFGLTGTVLRRMCPPP